MDDLKMKGPVAEIDREVPERDDAEWDEPSSAEAVYEKYMPKDEEGKPVPWEVGEEH